MTEHLPRALVQLIRARAGDTCEYCRLPQQFQEAAFHVDHIIPRAAGGPTIAANLALACVTCSLRKGARVRARDTRSRALVRLFHPRQDDWNDHFRWSTSWRLLGRTATGRATIRALGMNRNAILAIRRLLARLGQPLG